MDGEKKDGRGGARPGAGRPATGRKVIFSTTTISGSAEEIALLKQKAKDAGKSVSRYVLDWVGKADAAGVSNGTVKCQEVK